MLDADRKYKRIPPGSLHLFKGITAEDTVVNVPELHRGRRCTDIFFIIGLVLAICTWLSAYIVLLTTFDTDKSLRVKDPCDNYCGLNNIEYEANYTEEIPKCEAKDFTEHTVFDVSRRKCIRKETCKLNSDRVLIFNMCINSNDYDTQNLFRILEDILKLGPTLLVTLFFALGIFVFIYVLLFFYTIYTFIGLMVCSSVGYIVGVGVFWPKYVDAKTPEMCLGAVYSTILMVYTFILIALCGRRQYKLIISMYAETTAIIFKMPFLLFIPLLTFLFLLGIGGLNFYLTARALIDYFILPVNWRSTDDYKLVILRMIFLSLAISSNLWFLSFCNGCQCMVVSGAIASFYFKSDHTFQCKPVLISLLNTLRYHLGSISLGMLVLPLLIPVRALADLSRRAVHRTKINGIKTTVLVFTIWICDCLQQHCEYVSKRAYIMTAMHGEDLIKSGRRAANLLWEFKFDTVLVDLVSYMAMHIFGLLVVLGGMGIALAMMPDVTNKYIIIYLTINLCMVGILTFFYASLMNVSTETIILCYCEDKLLNDGSLKNPYFMSKRLMELIDLAIEEKMSKQ